MARQACRGRADSRRLRRRLPSFPRGAEIAEAKQALAPAYQHYVETVSTAGMAVSLETSAVLLALCRVERVSSAIDLGSGFSSYVLRAWAKEAECEVVSVDDNPEWLGRTGEFLMAQGLRSDHLVLWPDYPGRQFDLVFHDLASGALRESAMPAAAGLGRRMVVFDDAQHAGHRRAMTQACAGAGLELYSLRALTLDSIHRYAMIGVL